MNIVKLLPSQIRTDGGTQPRSRIDPDTVDEYANEMKRDAMFPPLVVFYDGEHYWLADGFHRLYAHNWAREGKPIECNVLQGTQRDAILYSVGANARHGLRRTNEDKRRAVTRLLEDDEWGRWSDNEIARRCQVSQPFVSGLRSSLITIISDEPADERTYTTKHGTVATMNTANIGSKFAAAEDEAPSVAFVDSEPKPYGKHDILPNGHSPTYTAARAVVVHSGAGRPVDNIQNRTPILVAHSPEEILEASKNIRKQQHEERKEEKVQAATSLPAGTYNVVYADPPWPYNNTGVSGAANHHYQTMKLEDICRAPVDINLNIADDAVLFLWVTSPFLRDAFSVIDAWGFVYKTSMVWVKTELQKLGNGFYVRGRHEFLFICTRGSFTPLNSNVSPPIGSVLEAPVREHSRKPAEVYDIIERLYPGCNCIELFARCRRDGWEAWGNEIDAFAN